MPKKEYRKCENHCPKCNSENISSIGTCFADVVYQKLVCKDCGCGFKEYYKYSDTEIDGEE